MPHSAKHATILEICNHFFPSWCSKLLFLTDTGVNIFSVHLSRLVNNIHILGQRGSNQNSSRPQVQHQRPRQVQTSLTSCPYKKWNLYFPDSGKLTLSNCPCTLNPENKQKWLGVEINILIDKEHTIDYRLITEHCQVALSIKQKICCGMKWISSWLVHLHSFFF